MYHFLIRRQIRRIVADLNRSEYEAALGNMAARFEHRFSSDIQLAGPGTVYPRSGCGSSA